MDIYDKKLNRIDKAARKFGQWQYELGSKQGYEKGRVDATRDKDNTHMEWRKGVYEDYQKLLAGLNLGPELRRELWHWGVDNLKVKTLLDYALNEKNRAVEKGLVNKILFDEPWVEPLTTADLKPEIAGGTMGAEAYGTERQEDAEKPIEEMLADRREKLANWFFNNQLINGAAEAEAQEKAERDNRMAEKMQLIKRLVTTQTIDSAPEINAKARDLPSGGMLTWAMQQMGEEPAEKEEPKDTDLVAKQPPKLSLEYDLDRFTEEAWRDKTVAVICRDNHQSRRFITAFYNNKTVNAYSYLRAQVILANGCKFQCYRTDLADPAWLGAGWRSDAILFAVPLTYYLVGKLIYNCPQENWYSIEL